MSASVSHRQRLGQARHAFEQDVPAGQQADQDALDHRLLADDDLADLGAELVDEGGLFVDELVDDADVHGGAQLTTDASARIFPRRVLAKAAMARDQDAKNSRLFDRRTVERNIKKGLITRKDYEKHLKALEDVADKGRVRRSPSERHPTPTDEAETDDRGQQLRLGGSSRRTANRRSQGH